MTTIVQHIKIFKINRWQLKTHLLIVIASVLTCIFLFLLVVHSIYNHRTVVSKEQLASFVKENIVSLSDVCNYLFQNPGESWSPNYSEEVTDNSSSLIKELKKSRILFTKVYMQENPKSVHFRLPTYYPGKDIEGCDIQVTAELIFCEEEITNEFYYVIDGISCYPEIWEELSEKNWYYGYFYR